MRSANAVASAADSTFSRRKGEFIAAETCQGVAWAQTLFQSPRHCDEEQIADRMAEAVVHNFEPIEVEKQHGSGMVVPALHARDHLLETFQKQGSICETHKFVMECEVQKSLFGELALRDFLLEGERAPQQRLVGVGQVAGRSICNHVREE